MLHHSEYIQRLLKAHRIDPKIGDLNFTYHDPCELGRGSGIYDAPREVIAAVGRLTEVAENREKRSAAVRAWRTSPSTTTDSGKSAKASRQPLPPPGPMRSSRPVRCARKESPGAIRCLFTILRKSSPKHYDTGRSGGCCDRRQESPPLRIRPDTVKLKKRISSRLERNFSFTAVRITRSRCRFRRPVSRTNPATRSLWPPKRHSPPDPQNERPNGRHRRSAAGKRIAVASENMHEEPVAFAGGNAPRTGSDLSGPGSCRRSPP